MHRFSVSLPLLFLLVGSPLTATAQPAAKQSTARTEPTASAKDAQPISGKVLQSMNSSGYSYVFLQKQNGEKVWLAVPETQVSIGKQMTFKPGMEMKNFESKTLKRSFETIIFSEGVISGGKSAMEDKKSPGSKGAVVAAGEKIKVGKAAGPNGYTVAELYKLKSKLDKKKVAVKGKVIKVSSGIMNKTWIHLQDGSGSAKKGNNDLVVTSQTVPAIGDVVTATGTLYKDKDFGGGYKYGIIMEQAEIRTE